MTPSSAVSDENFVKMIFLFQCIPMSKQSQTEVCILYDLYYLSFNINIHIQPLNALSHLDELTTLQRTLHID